MSGFLAIQDWSGSDEREAPYAYWHVSWAPTEDEAKASISRLAGDKPDSDTFAIPMSAVLDIPKLRARVTLEQDVPA